jgi:hypothetical protein
MIARAEADVAYDEYQERVMIFPLLATRPKNGNSTSTSRSRRWPRQGNGQFAPDEIPKYHPLNPDVPQELYAQGSGGAAENFAPGAFVVQLNVSV